MPVDQVLRILIDNPLLLRSHIPHRKTRPPSLLPHQNAILILLRRKIPILNLLLWRIHHNLTRQQTPGPPRNKLDLLLSLSLNPPLNLNLNLNLTHSLKLSLSLLLKLNLTHSPLPIPIPNPLPAHRTLLSSQEPITSSEVSKQANQRQR